MTIGLFLLIGGILNLIALIVSLMLTNDLRVLAFLIFAFIPYAYAIGAVCMGIVWLIDKLKRELYDTR